MQNIFSFSESIFIFENDNSVEIFLRNFSFLTLFISMMFYWIQTAFSFLGNFKTYSFLRQNQAPSSYGGQGGDLSLANQLFFRKKKSTSPSSEAAPPHPKVGGQSSLWWVPERDAKAPLFPYPAFLKLVHPLKLAFPTGENVGILSMIISNFLLTFLLIFRWKESGHFPLSNLYESLMFLSWSCTFIHLFLVRQCLLKAENVTPFTLAFFRLFLQNQEKEAKQAENTALASQPWNSPEFPGGENKKRDVVGNSVFGPGVCDSEGQSLFPNRKKVSKELKRQEATFLIKIIGSITAPSAFFTNAFATFSLPTTMQKSMPLVPALQSNWLMMHVTVMIISYSALILGSLLSIAFLILINTSFFSNKSKIQSFSLLTKQLFAAPAAAQALYPDPFLQSKPGIQPLLRKEGTPRKGKLDMRVAPHQKTFLNNKKEVNVKEKNFNTNIKSNFKLNRISLAWNLDNLSYRILGLGFPFLTIGILSGAVWANEAWGSYWSWDPKETWALLTWLIFAIYLHARITKGWQGKKPAIIASMGFFTIWICFLGVNLIGEGLHSYGWFSST